MRVLQKLKMKKKANTDALNCLKTKEEKSTKRKLMNLSKTKKLKR